RSTSPPPCMRAMSPAIACPRRTWAPGGCRSTASSTCSNERSRPSPRLPDRRASARVRAAVSPILLLLLQLLLVLAPAKACGAVLRHAGQPPVIGEMAAGLLLAPLVFGASWP